MKKLNQTDLALIEYLTIKPSTISKIFAFYKHDLSRIEKSLNKLIDAWMVGLKDGKYYIK